MRCSMWAPPSYHHPSPRLSMGTMSKLFVQRAFERFSRASHGRLMMDLHGFVDFMLAWDARATLQGMAVLFPVFDLDGKGYLTETDLYTFLREIHELWLSFGQSAELKLLDMVADVVDIVRPKDRNRIRATDILRCGMPATLMGMLADVNTFWEYENRESLQQQQGGEELEVV